MSPPPTTSSLRLHSTVSALFFRTLPRRPSPRLPSPTPTPSPSPCSMSPSPLRRIHLPSASSSSSYHSSSSTPSSRLLTTTPTTPSITTTTPNLKPRIQQQHQQRRYHLVRLLHPTTRQRLTNWTFYLCAFVSIATVSLTMSGSIGDGKTLPCPARTRIGAGLQEEEKEEGEEEEEERLRDSGRDRKTKRRRMTDFETGGGGRGKDTKMLATRSRWLEDPQQGSDSEQEIWRPGKDGKLYKVTPSTTTGKEEADGGISRLPRGVQSRRDQDQDQCISTTETGDRKSSRRGNAIAWRDWVGLSGKSGEAPNPSRSTDERVV